MKKAPLLLIGVLLLTACQREYSQNPDPNHTHADFAVWIDGNQLDFSDPSYMSGLSTDEHSHDEEGEYHHEHMHLHDSVGHVVHVHKTGLPLKEFFESLPYRFPQGMRMFVANPTARQGEELDWREMPFTLDYVFDDMDMILFTNAKEDMEIYLQQNFMTDDACLYSQTCPWRGEPPAENCIADPAVPCVVPEEDL